jgi:hypothetical protein
MKRYANLCRLLWPLLVVLFTTTAFAKEWTKQAQTGFQFLSVAADAKAVALGQAVTSLEMGSSSLFYNPAGMANMKQFFDVTASYNKWIADIQHNTFSLAINPAHGRWGVIGFSAHTVNYGDRFYGTVVADNEAGYLDTGDLKPTAFAFGVGYARALSDRFSIGAHVRWAKQDFGTVTIPESDSTLTKKSYDLMPMSFDFGTLYQTGFKSLVFGMSIRNFSKEIKYEEEGFQLPLIFNLGISMDLFDFLPWEAKDQSALLMVNATHDRSHPEQILLGVDYSFKKMVSLRAGYVSHNDEDAWSYGAGFSLIGISLDYAYTPFGVFDQVQRMTARFAW